MIHSIVAAPLMKYSTPHYRKLLKLIYPNLTVYSEMFIDQVFTSACCLISYIYIYIWHVETICFHVVLFQAILHFDQVKLETFLGKYEPHTVVQIASSSPETFVSAIAKILAFDPHFTEFNLNCGCPSHKLKCQYGAALMAKPKYPVYQCAWLYPVLIFYFQFGFGYLTSCRTKIPR